MPLLDMIVTDKLSKLQDKYKTNSFFDVFLVSI